MSTDIFSVARLSGVMEPGHLMRIEIPPSKRSCKVI